MRESQTARLSHYLIDDELKVPVNVKPLNPKFGGDAHTVYQGLILDHVIGGTKVQLNNIKELISFKRDQHYTSPSAVEGKRAIEVHASMLLSDLGVRLLSLGPFGYKIRQGMGLDHRLGHIGYVEPECPFVDPSHGEMVPNNFFKPKRGYHMDRVALEVVQEIALRD
jgi:hypothetical protein